LCASGAVRRLGVVDVQAGAASLGASTGTANSVAGALPALGGVRIYQAWYRNSAPFCTSASFNFTNGLRVTWIP
jgi:hypothetical protein